MAVRPVAPALAEVGDTGVELEQRFHRRMIDIYKAARTSDTTRLGFSRW
ncbi:MAG: hypothetical protein WKF55_02455 [Gemmatimonadaceae bacterium]